MGIYLQFKSGQQHELKPQIRLTHSKNGTTGTAIIEANINNLSLLANPEDPISDLAFKRNNYAKAADICHFIWYYGKPIKVIGVFIFSDTSEKQDFFDYYLYNAIDSSLEFFPAQLQEKTLKG